MNVIVVGCGRVGAELAYNLFRRDHTVTVIDQTAAAFQNLHPNFRGRTIEGEVLNEDVLRRAGLEGADGLAAVTSSDTTNAVIGHLARTIFAIPNIIIRNYDPDRKRLIEAFDLQIVASSSWGAQRIEELLYQSEVRAVFSAGNGEVEVYEFLVPEAWVGRQAGELFDQEGSFIIAITRSGRAILPARNMLFNAGDILLVSATDNGIQDLRRRMLETQEA